jgi:hypothetical protein
VNEYSFILFQCVLLPLAVGNKHFSSEPTVLLVFPAFSVISLPWQGLGSTPFPMLTEVLLPAS